MASRYLLAGLVDRTCRRAWLVVLAGVLLASLGGLYAWRHLGVSTDTDLLFSASLPWRQRQMTFEREFPQSKQVLVAVIDSAIPEEADATAASLAQALAADRTHFKEVWRPDASPYFDQEGLLFLDKQTLGGLLDRTIDAQPFLGQLVADPSARGLFSALTLLAIGVQRGVADLTPFAAPLHAFETVLHQAASATPPPLSWERLLSGSLADLGGPYRFVVMHPTLDYGAVEPGGDATQALRALAAKQEFVAGGTARVRVTGDVALADEEFATAAQGMLEGTIGSIVLIAFWLLLAVRSWRLIVPILATLMLGLVLTVTFAALAVGTLNLISVAFAILFVGIAVDFAIQFSVRYRDARLTHPEPREAMATTAHHVGGQIAVAAAATAAGFLAFVPTSFSGVAELGLIAGVGMVIAFLCTLFFLPAALTVCRPRGEKAEVGFRWGRTVEQALVRGRVPVLAVFAALAVAGAVLLPRLTFDSDPLHTKDPNTQAMRTLADLINNPLTDPYSVDIITPSTPAAAAMADRLRSLPLVGSVRTIMSFVPEDQQAKLGMISDAAGVLQATLAPRSPAAPVTPSDLRIAIRTVLSQAEPALTKLPADHPLVAIVADLRALATVPDERLMGMNAAFDPFPAGADRPSAPGAVGQGSDRRGCAAADRARLGAGGRALARAGTGEVGGHRQRAAGRLRAAGADRGTRCRRHGGDHRRDQPDDHRGVSRGRDRGGHCDRRHPVGRAAPGETGGAGHGAAAAVRDDDGRPAHRRWACG